MQDTNADPELPCWKAAAGNVLRRFPIVARSGAGPAYLRWQRRRSRAARVAAESRGDMSLSRPALHALDEKLDRWIGDVRGGFFVEAGANDGFTQSNTYHLERFRDWTGLLVEAVPHLYREAVEERPRSHVRHAALVPPERDGEQLSLRYAGLMSVVHGARGSADADEAHIASAFALGLEAPMTVTAVGRTLSRLLDEIDAPGIDLMSLDLEGFEAPALRGLDIDRHAPRYLLVEVAAPEERAAVEAVLGTRYRHEAMLTQRDALYARSDQPQR